MAKIHAYLNFNGDCEKAFTFYETVFETKNIGMHYFGDLPTNEQMPLSEESKKRVMHTALMINESTMLMGSDFVKEYGQEGIAGNNLYIMLDVDSAEEAKRLYDRLAVNAKRIDMPLGEQFWAELYASFQDQFGICWMIHYEGKNCNN